MARQASVTMVLVEQAGWSPAVGAVLQRRPAAMA